MATLARRQHWDADGGGVGVDVVDIDVHAGGNGFAAFERARSAGLADGWAWLVRTPSGGVHAYYLRRPVDEQRSWQVPESARRLPGRRRLHRCSAVAGIDDGRPYELITVAQHRATPR